MIDLFIHCKDIASCPWTKQSHLGKCSNRKLRTSTLVNDGTLRSTADIVSALSNINNVEMFDLLEFLLMLLFSCLCSHPKIFARFWKHPWERFFFDNIKKSLIEVSLLSSIVMISFYIVSERVLLKHKWLSVYLL